MGVEDDVETKRLRRLRDTQACAFRRRFDVSVCVDQLDGIVDRYRGNGCSGARCSLDGARNQRRRDEWPRRVVDQDDIGPLVCERLKSGMYRGLARRAAIGGRLIAQTPDRIVENGGAVGVDHPPHPKKLWVTAEKLPPPRKHRLPPPPALFLWPP